MKTKIILGLAAIFAIVNLFHDSHQFVVSAQDLPVTEPSIENQIIQAENDYRSQFDIYRTAYSEYTRTKAIWKSSKTLQAEQEALSAGKTAATARDDVMIAYTRWLRLQLLQFLSTYSKGATVAEGLLQQTQWFEIHKAKISSTTTIASFDSVMAEYSDPVTALRRENLFSIAQLELKLAHSAFFQHQARALYDPILRILETKRDIPAVEQGFVRINELNNKINTDLVEISNLGGSIEAESFNQRQFLRIVNERLSILQSNQISLLNYIIELESRYAR